VIPGATGGATETLVGPIRPGPCDLPRPFLLLAGMSLRTVQATDHCAGTLCSATTWGLQLVTIALALVATLTICLGIPVTPLRFKAPIVLIGLAKALELISDLFYSLQQAARPNGTAWANRWLSRESPHSFAVATGVYLTGKRGRRSSEPGANLGACC